LKPWCDIALTALRLPAVVESFIGNRGFSIAAQTFYH